MRDFMIAFSSLWGSSSSEGLTRQSRWDALIETSYMIIGEVQCNTTGLVTNWWVPSRSWLATAGSPGCSGSGTPAAEFGSEASRYAWRISLAWLWYGDARAQNLMRTLAAHAASALSNYGVNGCWNVDGCPALRLSPGCQVATVITDWVYNYFMLGPVSSSFMVPPATSTQQTIQQTALQKAAQVLSGATISDYFAGSWVRTIFSM